MSREMPDLDSWLSDSQVRTHHRRVASVDADDLWRAAERLRVGDTPILGRLLRWRIPGTDDGLAYRELFRAYPFVPLGEGPGWFISGLCGQIWTLRGDYPRLETASDFTAWREPGTVRVLFAHWVKPLTEGGSEIRSEARVEPVDGRARWKMGALWAALGRFEMLVGREVLNTAVQRSERRNVGHCAALSG